MAITPKQGSNGSKQASGGARFRQRKISVKQPLTIYKQRDLPSLDASNELEPSQIHHLSLNAGAQQRDLHSIETGVDKNEEDEVHLQQVIHAAQRALMSSKNASIKETKKQQEQVYIPTPDASKLWTEADHYYNDHTFREPESYIKFSATIEDTVGIEYNMDEEDEEFLNNVLNNKFNREENASNNSKSSDTNNKSKSKFDAPPDSCTETEFELICDKLEKTIEEKQPFIATDPESLLSYEETSAYILEEYNSSDNDKAYIHSNTNSKYISTTTLKEKLARELSYYPFRTLYDKDPWNAKEANSARPIPELLKLFGKPIYEHWKQRKVRRKGKPIFPSLKFEDPNATEKDNDNDPYICFRRREFRQARKTRRADTLGAERIRLLQRSMQRARDLVLAVSKREVTKLRIWESDRKIFELRSEAKSLKRAAGVRGDDYLFYAHKKRKPTKIKIEEEEKDFKKRERKSRYETARDGTESAISSSMATHRDRNAHYNQASSHESGNVSQPYVKLPPSKIPDMDLVTVSLVLREKNETIKRAVLEKLRKRKEQDKSYVNFTDDPYQPYFDIKTDEDHLYELSHIPYSSIAASLFHQFNTSNCLSDRLRNILEEGKKPLPGLKSFRGSNGELIPSKEFPHLLTLLQEHINNNSVASDNYIAQLLSNIETNNFSAYNVGYGHSQRKSSDAPKLSDPVFRMRKRMGRLQRTFIDRRGLIKEADFINLDDLISEDEIDDDSMVSSKNVYDSAQDEVKRLKSRWKFDTDLTEYEKGIQNPFSLDPSKLNCISDDTQSIRFGSMLLSKSYDLLREAMHQRQQILQHNRIRSSHQLSTGPNKTQIKSHLDDIRSRSSANLSPMESANPINHSKISKGSKATTMYNDKTQNAYINDQTVNAKLPTQSSGSCKGPLLESQSQDGSLGDSKGPHVT